jgi:hypothetical protein
MPSCLAFKGLKYVKNQDQKIICLGTMDTLTHTAISGAEILPPWISLPGDRENSWSTPDAILLASFPSPLTVRDGLRHAVVQPCVAVPVARYGLHFPELGIVADDPTASDPSWLSWRSRVAGRTDADATVAATSGRTRLLAAAILGPAVASRNAAAAAGVSLHTARIVIIS